MDQNIVAFGVFLLVVTATLVRPWRRKAKPSFSQARPPLSPPAPEVNWRPALPPPPPEVDWDPTLIRIYESLDGDENYSGRSRLEPRPPQDSSRDDQPAPRT